MGRTGQTTVLSSCFLANAYVFCTFWSCLIRICRVCSSSIYYNILKPFSFIFQDSQGKKSFAKSYINEMAKEAVFTDRKRNELNKIWSQIFYEMVYSALSDMSDMPSYSKKCLEELEKT